MTAFANADEIDRRMDVAEAGVSATLEDYYDENIFAHWYDFLPPVAIANVITGHAASALLDDFSNMRDDIRRKYIEATEGRNEQGRITALADMEALDRQIKAQLLGIKSELQLPNGGTETNQSEYGPQENPDLNYTPEAQVKDAAAGVKDAAVAILPAAGVTLIIVGIVLAGAIVLHGYAMRRGT